MCGRFTLAADGRDLVEEYQAQARDDTDQWPATYSVAPRTMVPLVREHRDHDGQAVRTLEPGRWGFHPAWAKENGPRPINARLETVVTSGMFRTAYASSRAVVPMTGYYEWVDTPTGKQPYLIHDPDHPVLSAAAVATSVQDPDGRWVVNFAVITRQAADAGGQVHDRMPVFLTPDALTDYLTPDKLTPTQRDELHHHLQDASATVAGRLLTHPVDRKLNNVRTLTPTDPTLIDPFDPASDEPE